MSYFFPVGQRNQFVQNFLQSLEPTLLICRAGHLLAAFQVQAVRFPNLRYFFSQFSDALFDGLLHDD
jgi:hypothetical protein